MNDIRPNSRLVVENKAQKELEQIAQEYVPALEKTGHHDVGAREVLTRYGTALTKSAAMVGAAGFALGYVCSGGDSQIALEGAEQALVVGGTLWSILALPALRTGDKGREWMDKYFKSPTEAAAYTVDQEIKRREMPITTAVATGFATALGAGVYATTAWALNKIFHADIDPVFAAESFAVYSAFLSYRSHTRAKKHERQLKELISKRTPRDQIIDAVVVDI